MRVLFFGMTGQFSVPPLLRLLRAGVPVSAIIVPAPRGSIAPLPRQLPKSTMLSADYLPLLETNFNPNIIRLGWQRQIPVWEVGQLSSRKSLALLTELQPDVIIVACFSRLFPPQLLSLPRYGCLNLHPSLLPAYRGPEPLFWIAYHDERSTGVTLHLLDDGMDSGDIIAQTRFERPDGLSYADLESRCAAAGADLLLAALRQLQEGQTLPRRPQGEAEVSYFSAPTTDDFLIPAHWPARRAFNFACGAAGWPLAIQLGESRPFVRVAKSYDLDHTLDRPFILLGDEVWVQFNPGVLRAKIWPERKNH